MYTQNFSKIFRIAEVLRAIGTAHNDATSGQICLAWLLAQGDDIIPIGNEEKKRYVTIPPTSGYSYR